MHLFRGTGFELRGECSWHADRSASRRMGCSVAMVGDKFFGDSVLEGGSKQRQDATIGMMGLGM
ncbi:MAG TPA: hypothetical protein VGK19_15615 [Capsulimonadaceae bacterium]